MAEVGKGVMATVAYTPTVDVRRSYDVAARTDAQPQRCFANAWDALPFYPEARYVEGVVVLLTAPDRGPVEVAEHGWLEAADGTVVDPSLPYLVSLLPNGEGSKVLPVYFAAARWNAQEAAGFEECQVCRPATEPIPPELEAAYAAALAWVGPSRTVVRVPVEADDGWNDACEFCGRSPDWCWCGGDR